MPHILGIDLGETNLKLHINNGVSDFFDSVPSTKELQSSDFKKYISSFLNKNNIKKIDGIGFAHTGISTKNKVIHSKVSSIINADSNFLSEFSNNLIFINDANAVAIYTKNIYPEYKNTITLTVGTCIGYGIILNNKLFYGGNGLSGEHRNFTLINDEFVNIENIATGSHILSLVNNGVPLENALDETAKQLTCLITHLYDFFDPEVIFLTGGAFKYDNFFELVSNYVKKLSDCKLILLQNTSFSGCFGAEYLVENSKLLD